MEKEEGRRIFGEGRRKNKKLENRKKGFPLRRKIAKK